MTRSPDLPRKRHKWLGRLLGCFSGKSHVEGSSDHGSGYIEHTSWLDPYSGEGARPRKAKRLEGKVGRTSLPSGRSGEWMSPCFFLGDLEWALLKEGLLEYRDPAASIPVLSICHGFSDEELKSLSKRRHYLQLNRLWDKEMVEGLDKVLRIDGLEPFIDGLPASVWLECVEPTLSILISLNALRHRRSNLSVKRGAPEVLDSSRSRHGDFEFGPIAIFHHPRRIQQMMLLRFEFLNTVTTDPVELGELHRSHDHIRRSYNRPRRFRNLRGTEDDGGPPSSKNRDDSIDARNNDKCVRTARGHVSACDTCRQPVLPEEHGCNSRSSSCCCNCSSSSCSCSSYTSSSCNSTSCNCSNNNSCTLNICPEIPACEQRSGNNLDTRVETSIRNPKPGRFPAIGQSPCHDLRQSLRCLNNNNNSSNNVSTDGGSPALIAISDRLQMLPGQDPSQSATGSAATRSEWPAMDIMALGDHTVWMLTSRRYITIPAQAHRRAWHGVIGITAIKGGTGDGEDATGMDRTEGRLSTRRSPWNFSRRLYKNRAVPLSRTDPETREAKTSLNLVKPRLREKPRDTADFLQTTMRGGFLFLLAAVAFVGGRAAFTCRSEYGNRLQQFNGYRARVELPCKYNAIKDQQCGDYIINVTPGITFNGVDYLSATAWLGVKRISDGKFIEFRTSYKIAGKYLTELKCEGSTTLLPIVKKDGDLEFADIFNYTPEDDGLGVIFTEKQNTWSFSFGLYQFKGSRFKSSDWSFTCNDDSVPLVPYPEQLCGNTSKNVLKDRTAGFTQWSDDVATVLLDALNNSQTVQYEQLEDFCLVSQDKLVNLCPDDAARERTIAACWNILGDKGHRKCLTKYTFPPIEIFANCVDWMCSGAPPKDPNKSCDKVAEAIDDCREFPILTSLVKASKCYSGLTYRLKDDSEGDSCP